MKKIFAFEKSVGGVIFRREENAVKFLVLHYRSGHWDFMKGHQEKGENDEMTLRRETQEETGIEDLEILENFQESMRYFYRAKGNEKEERTKAGRAINVIKKVIYYLAETKTKEVKISHEHTGFEWLEYDEMMKKLTFEASQKVLEKTKDATKNYSTKKE